MTQSPIVSVISTVYNGEEYLQQAIDSIRKQTLHDFEFVIVDDGSTDGTAAILRAAQADSRIVVVSESRVGRARALNLAWRAASGAYIANIDADDMAEPTRLEEQLAYLSAHPEVGMLSTDCRVLYEDDGKIMKERIAHPPIDDEALKQVLVRSCPIIHSTVMMPRHVLEAVDGYNENFTTAIDYELWIRIGSRYRLANLPRVLATRRVHDSRYFGKRARSWEKMKFVMAIRWNAWREFSRNPTDLGYVFAQPTARWLNTKLHP